MIFSSSINIKVIKIIFNKLHTKTKEIGFLQNFCSFNFSRFLLDVLYDFFLSFYFNI